MARKLSTPDPKGRGRSVQRVAQSKGITEAEGVKQIQEHVANENAKTATKKKPEKKQTPEPKAAAPKKDECTLEEFVRSLLCAIKVSDRGAVIAKYAHISFADGRMQAFDGLVHFQARSPFPPASRFALSEQRLAAALSLISATSKVEETDEFVRFKSGKLSVRIRKLDPDIAYYDRFKITREARRADGFLDAVKRAAPFMSEDASRPWSVSLLSADGYLYATNNLALVRVPQTLRVFESERIALPLPAVRHLCTLSQIDYVEEQGNMIVINSGKTLYRFPRMQGDWPDMRGFFEGFPKKMPELPAEMKAACASAAKLSERFTTIGAASIEAKSAAVESTYEIEVDGAGTFNSRLLALIAETATHADFTTFPKPIRFRGENIEGVALGVVQPPAAEGQP